MTHPDLLSYEADIPDRRAFVDYLAALAGDLHANPEAWNNADLESFLRVMASYLAHGLDAFSLNIRGPSPPSDPRHPSRPWQHAGCPEEADDCEAM
jgi:hypothetical protein